MEIEIFTLCDAAAWVMRDPAIDWSALNLPEMPDFQEEMQAWQSLSDEPAVLAIHVLPYCY